MERSTRDHELLDLFTETITKIIDTVSVKFPDYGGQMLLEFENVVISRCNDKMERIKNLLRHGKAFVEGESLEDSLVDLAAYSLWAIAVSKYIKKHKIKYVNGVISKDE
jgi:hypothetical protein